MTLAELHETIQLVMGWLDYHLYEFEIKGRRYAFLDEDTPAGEVDAGSVTLGDLRLRRKGTTFTYEYDFGDGWMHRVEVERAAPIDQSRQYPICTAGRRSCPPEDCGGVHGYARLLGIISDPAHPEHIELLEWLPDDFDPKAFDREAANSALQKHFGHSYTVT